MELIRSLKIDVAFVFALKDIKKLFEQFFVVDACVFFGFVVDGVDFENHYLVGFLVVFDKNDIFLALISPFRKTILSDL